MARPCSRRAVGLAVALMLASACRRGPGEISTPEPDPGSGATLDGEQDHAPAERGPQLPHSPAPPVLPNGCTHHAASDDPQYRLSLHLRFALPESRRDRPVVRVGDPLAFELELREPISILTPVEFCLQRPDGSVLRRQVQFRNADMLCPGCDPYRGAPPDVCAPEKICQVEYRTPSYQPFDATETSEPGAYLLSVEAKQGAFDPLSVVIEVAPRD